jgi:hypothetical protein
MNSPEMDAQNGEGLAFRTPGPSEAHDSAVFGTATPRPAPTVSIKKLEANRRNAQQSTGPRTEAGKNVSRLNAVTHGLLAKEVVISRGGYKEDRQAFAQLLNQLREQFTPVGVAQELEVETIALCYWRRMRAIRCEHGAIRQRTADVKMRKWLRRESARQPSIRSTFNRWPTARKIGDQLDQLDAVKQEVLDDSVTIEAAEWLAETFGFSLPEARDDESEEFEKSEEEFVVVPLESRRFLSDKLDQHRLVLSRLREKLARAEQLDLDSKIRAAALPGSRVVEKLVRYQASIDRELDRALKRLEQMQERRRANAGSPPAQ